MWHKEPLYPIGTSSYDTLNFLYQSDKFYIMDNHLAASWCWLQKIDIGKSYNLYHIDRHFDLLDSPSSVNSQIIDNGFDLATCSLDDYLGLKHYSNGSENVPLFRFDNYIRNLELVYNSIFNLKYFATHRDGNDEGFIDPDNGDFEKEDFQIVHELGDDITDRNDNQWIVNLDLDYFFLDDEGDYYQHLSDRYIKEICRNIENSLDNIVVVTIALSPESCGKLNNAYRIARMIANIFKLDFKLIL